MLNSIKLTNNVIIKCDYEPQCMLDAYKLLQQTETNDFIQNVIRLNIENLTKESSNFANFNKSCNNDAFKIMHQSEVTCLKKINEDISGNLGVARMRADKLSCMKSTMDPLMRNGNLFAAQKMINLLGQYGQLDPQDAARASFQQNQNKDAEQNFTACQALYDRLKPKFR